MAVISAERAGGVAITWFLDTIAYSEGTSTHKLTKNDGYDVGVTGIDGPWVFTDYSDHPFACGKPPIQINHAGLASTASGRYQILLKFWRQYKDRLNLPDFSPLSQDLYCLEQLKERHAIALILAGHVDTAIEACSNIWASFPGNAYGQGGKSMAELLAYYNSFKTAADAADAA